MLPITPSLELEVTSSSQIQYILPTGTRKRTFASYVIAYLLLMSAMIMTAQPLMRCSGIEETSPTSGKYFPAAIQDDCVSLLADADTRSGLPIVTVQINWHFIQDASNAPQHQWNTAVQQFNPIAIAASYTVTANTELADLRPAKIVNGNPLHDAVIGDSRIRLETAPNTSNAPEEVAEGIFIWPNIAAYNVHYAASNDDVFHIVANAGSQGNATGFTNWNANWMKLNNVDQERIDGTWWNWNQVIVHELGHAAGDLAHAEGSVSSCGSTRSCDDIDLPATAICAGAPGVTGSCGGSTTNCTFNSSNNVMESGGGAQRSLSPCQWSRFYSRTLQRSYSEVICEKSETDLVISPGTTNWSTSRFISQDVVVPAGSKLEIECTVYLVGGAVIAVQRGAILDINGGTLTRLCSKTEWQGIIVEGNNAIEQPDPDDVPFTIQAGIVRLRNNATIHGATAGIYTARYNIAYNTIEGWNAAYRGGVIKARDSRFIDNRRSVGFMEYNFDNKSSFKRNLFDNANAVVGNAGVTIWRCNQIEFVQNTFRDIYRDGIFGVNYSASIYGGNEFINCEYGIASESTTPFTDGFYIADNTFRDNSIYGIFLGQAGTASTRSFIAGNSNASEAGGYGIAGTSRFSLQKNFASGSPNNSYGIRVISTQSNYFNSIECNGIETFFSGIYLQGNNEQITTKTNVVKDVPYGIYYRNFGGETGVLQDQKEPKNCFFVNSNFELRAAGALVPCEYDDNASVFCEDVEALGTYAWTLIPIQSNPAAPCAPDMFTEDEGGGESKYEIVEGVGPDEEFNEGHEIIVDFVEQKDTDKLFSFTEATDHAGLKELGYGALVHLGSFETAQLILDQIETESLDFKRVQEILLDFRLNEKEFHLSNEDEEYLTNLAAGDEGQVDDILYARSILYLTKDLYFGDIFDAPHPEESESASESLIFNIDKSTTTIVAPNPVSESQFQLFVGSDIEGYPSMYEITNGVGQLVSSASITSDAMTINLPNVTSGVYSITLLREDGGVLKSIRFVKL